MASEVHDEISNGSLKENIEIEPLGENNVKAKSAEALIVDLAQSECSADERKAEEVEEPTTEEKQEPLPTTLEKEITLEKEKGVHEVGKDEEVPQEGNGYSVEEEVEDEVNEREVEGQYDEEEDDEEEYEEGKDDDEDEEAEPPSKRRK